MNVIILNSAQSKYPVGNDPWIQATIRAIRSIAECDVHILCSTDPSPWDLVTYLSGKSGMNVKLIIKAEDDEAGHREYKCLREEYALNESLTFPLFLGSQSSGPPKKVWQLRDRYALMNADVVYPVSIRPGGRLDTLLSEGNFRAEIRNNFRIEWSVRRKRRLYDFKKRSINPFPPGNWLVHWTRASQGPWPGEKAWEFHRDLIAHPTTYVRSASETLIRILTERKIRGSSWRLPAGETAVAFTSLEPENAVHLMRWRKRFVRYSLEPFGVGIKRNALAMMGARRVHYENSPSDTSDGERLFSQSPGKHGEWTKEKEWRIRGDLMMNKIETKDIVVIVPDESSAERIQPRIGNNYSIHTLFRN